MALNASFLNLRKRMALGNRSMAFSALYFAGHDVRLRLLLTEGFSPDEKHLRLMAIGAFRFGLVVTAQALHPGLIDFSMLLAGNVTDITVQQSRDMFLVRERDPVNHNLRILKSSVAFAALRMGDLGCLRQWNRPFRVAFGAGGLIPAMAFEAGLFGRSEGGRVVGIMVNIVVAGGAGVFQSLDMEPVRNGDIVRVDFRGGSLHIKDTLMAADAVWIDLVKFGRKTRMLASAFEGEDVDAWNQGMTGRMTLRAVDLGMER